MTNQLVIIKPHEFELGTKSVTGKFNVESFEKNYGTFEEDVTIKSNVDCEELFLDGKPSILGSLKSSEQNLIKDFVLSKT